MLAKRSARFMYNEEQILRYSAYKALKNPFDALTNPQGIINMGTAINGLMDDIILDRFKEKNNFFEPSAQHFRYYRFWGSEEFQQKLATFMTIFFGTPEPISRDNIFVLNGALLSLDILVGLIADEEEIVLFPSPCYPSYSQAGFQRWNVKMCPIPLSNNLKTGELFELTIDQIEKAFQEQLSLRKKVKAFLLNNPHNPLGKVFPAKLVLEIMRFCQRNNLHLIADEVYCMSVFDESTSFKSVLALKSHKDNILDADRIHVYWGFSKDLCLTSYRTGVIHTENEKLKMAIKSTSQFQAVPLPILNILENYITELSWFEKIFVPKNHGRLRNAYIRAKTFFDELRIPTTPTTAGFFFLADFSQYLKTIDEKGVQELVDTFYDHKIYITPSWEMKIKEPGWFRIVFTFSEEIVEEGLSRLRNALEQVNKSDQSLQKPI